MGKKNNCVRTGSSKILWAVMAILLCSAPHTLAVDYIIDAEETGPIYLYSGDTLKLLPGGFITNGLYAFSESMVNITGGGVGSLINVSEGAMVTITGTNFAVTNGTIDSSGSYFTIDDIYSPSVLTGTYGAGGGNINLTFYSDSGVQIYLAAPITVNIEKAKVSWDHSDIHVDGKLYLLQGFWMDNLEPVGSAVITLAGVKVANQSVKFEIKGKKDDKWEYKDKENPYGNLKEFKIDWKGAKFDYKGDEGLHIHTHHIGGTETTLCIHCDKISGAFTVSVNETEISYDDERSITTDLEYEPQKDDNTHVHFTFPFELTSDMTIEVSGSVELIIAVTDYYEEGFIKFKVVSIFDPEHEGSEPLPDELECVISLGDMIAGSDLIGAWTKKDDKHWEYK